MTPLHYSIHVRPDPVPPGPRVAVGGRAFASLAVPARRQADPWELSFEEAAAALARLPRMFVEPDGAFVWRDASWQLDGLLVDRNHRLAWVELKGRCPEPRLDELLRGLGWPATPLMFQLVQQAVFLEEAEFRRLAFESASAL